MAGGFKRIEDYDVVDPVVLPDDAVIYTVLPNESTPALIDRHWNWLAFKNWLVGIIALFATGPREIITADTTLVFGKKYLISGDYELTLPANPVEGDAIDILSEGYATVIQTDAEHIIEYKTKYFTIKGSAGYLSLYPRDRLVLVYKGVQNYQAGSILKLSDPGTKPGATCNGVTFSYDGIYLGAAASSTPYVHIYKRAGDTFTKLSDPTGDLPTNAAKGASFTRDAAHLAISSVQSPFIQIYKRSGDAFAKVADPTGGLPPDQAHDCAFSHDGNYLAVAHQGTPYLTVYSRSGDVFTKLSNPSSLPASNGISVGFSSDNNFILIGTQSSPYAYMYKLEGGALKQMAFPTQASTIRGVAFSHNGDYVACGVSVLPNINILKRNGNTWVALTPPVSLPAGAGFRTSFSRNDLFLTVSHGASPYVTVYQRFGDTFVKLTDPVTPPTGNAEGAIFSEDGFYMVVGHSTDPWLTFYINKTSANKVWIIEEFDIIDGGSAEDGGGMVNRFK